MSADAPLDRCDPNDVSNGCESHRRGLLLTYLNVMPVIRRCDTCGCEALLGAAGGTLSSRDGLIYHYGQPRADGEPAPNEGGVLATLRHADLLELVARLRRCAQSPRAVLPSSPPLDENGGSARRMEARASGATSPIVQSGTGVEQMGVGKAPREAPPSPGSSKHRMGAVE